MCVDKIMTMISKMRLFIRLHLKELIFGFYLCLALSVSVIASMQGGSGYGSMMFFSLVLLSIFMVVPKIKKKIETLSCVELNSQNGKGIQIFIAFFLLSFLCFLFWYVAYFPGAFSLDSIDQFKQALRGEYNDWHPVLHTLFSFALPLKLTGLAASIVFFQILLFSIVLGLIAKTIYSYCGKKWTLVLVLPIILSPWTLNISMYPWKDVTFALSSAMCMIFAVNIFFQRESWSKPVWNIMLLSFFLMLATVFRHNGILLTMPLAIALFFYMPIKRWLLFIVLFVVAIGVVRGPVYTILNVQKPGNRVVETSGFPLSVIIYVAKECPQCLDKETANFVSSLTKTEPNWKKNYSLEGFNSIKFADDGIDFNVVENTGRLKIMKMMLVSFKNAPIYSAIAIGGLTSIIYGLEINCDNDPKVVENKYGIVYKGNEMMRNAALFYSMIVKKTPIRFFICTIGMPLIIMIAFILFRSRLDNECLKRILLCSPILVYDFGTMLFLSGAESRFFYVNLLICPLVVVVMLGKFVEERPKNENGFLPENLNQ